MISWLQRTLQRHYKWLFMGLLAIIIVAFVFTIGASPGIGTSEGKNRKQMYYGYNLNSQRDVQELLLDANISYLLNTGMPVVSQEVAQEQALIRPPLLSLANSLQIPSPNESELVEYIKSKPIFRNKEGQFDAKAYNEFLTYVEHNPQLSQDRVRQTLAQDYRMDKVVKSIGGPGFVLPYEAQLALERQDTLWSIDIASINISDFKSDIKVTDADLQSYYEQNKFKYALPERVSASYAFFPASDYINSVGKPTDEELEKYFNANTDLFKNTKNEAAPKFQDVKSMVLMSWKAKQSKNLSAEAASEFAYELYEKDVKHNSPEFTALVKKHNLSIKSLPPYAADKLPSNTGLPQPLLKQAFSLNSTHFYSDVTQTAEGSAILFLDEQLPITVPPMNQVKELVSNDYLRGQNLKLLETKGKVLDTLLQKAVKENKNFKSIAESQGLTVTSFNDFKITSPPTGLDKLLLSDIQTLNENQVSPIIINDQLGRFIYIRKKTTPRLAANDEQVVELVAKLENFTASANIQGFLNQLINKELKRE